MEKTLLLTIMIITLFGCASLGGQTNDDMAAREIQKQPGFVSSEFIFTEAPFPECHASTIEEVDGQLITAWFAGTHEKHKDVGIWVSRFENNIWSTPEEVATGIQHQDKRYPCWNPVLFQPRIGPLMLFYKVGPSPSEWWGELRTSNDRGESWSQNCRLPEDILGPIKNKPIQLSNGDLLSPSSTEHEGWKVHLERTPDLGKSWEIIGPVNSGEKFGAIQPTLLQYPESRLQMLCRSRQGVITESWSDDNGKTWSPMTATGLPNPNSGIDAVTLRNGLQILVYNHTKTPKGKWGGPRSPLNVAISKDGIHWEAALILEDEPGAEFSYPAVIQSDDGLVHIVYTWKRDRVKHVVIDPDEIQSEEIKNGNWPGSK